MNLIHQRFSGGVAEECCVPDRKNIGMLESTPGRTSSSFKAIPDFFIIISIISCICVLDPRYYQFGDVAARFLYTKYSMR